MLRTEKFAPEGHTVFTYEAGKTYHLPEKIAADFIEAKAAVEAGEKAVEGAPANKAVNKAPANKAK